MKTTAPRSKGFTLIEILVVIAIIGILAAIIMPVLGGIRSRADLAKQTSHLREIYHGITKYAVDNDNRLPPANGDSWEFSREGTASIPLDNFGSPTVLKDPADKRQDPTAVSYAINDWLPEGKHEEWNGHLANATHPATTYWAMPFYQGDPKVAASWTGTQKSVKLFNVSNVPTVGINGDETINVLFGDGGVRPVALKVLKDAAVGYDPRDPAEFTTASN